MREQKPSMKVIEHIDEVVENILHPDPSRDNTIAQLNLVAHLGEVIAPRWATIRERLVSGNASRAEDRRDLSALLQEFLDQCDNQDCSLCERGRAALSATADRGLAVESVLASSRLVDHEGQCVTCWTYVGDPDPEPHAPGCLIERLRAALSTPNRTVRDA